MHVQTRQQSSTETPSRVRLICLACTRQQLIQYRTWAHTLSDPIELIAIDVPAAVLPGTQPASTLAKTLAERLQPYLAQPHALFGQYQGRMSRWPWRIWPRAPTPGRLSICLFQAVTAPSTPMRALPTRPSRSPLP